jgi:hypothetical protein
MPLGRAAHRAALGRQPLRTSGLDETVAELVRPDAERYGITIDDELLLGSPRHRRPPTGLHHRLPVTGSTAVSRWS